ncbi:hypothetical protein GCM10027343_21410 [Noviherbaspirillum agri]
MKSKFALALVAVMVFLTGCATSRTVTVGQLAPQKKITTAALVPQEGNSAEMDAHVRQQIMAYGITPKASLPSGTRQSNDVDVIVGYSDVWRWDVVMYLKTLTINLFDGPSGNLLVTGRWDNSAFHGFQNPQDVTKELLDDMFAKLQQSK